MTEPQSGNTKGTPNPETVSTKQLRIAERARKFLKPLTNLACMIDRIWMLTAHARTRADGSPGVDGQTGLDFEANRLDRLEKLIDEAKSGRYKAPPVKRTYIPKANGTKRPIGVPTFGDKVLQRAVAMVLEPLYEEIFHECSFGFRPGRSAHQAIDMIIEEIWKMKGRVWILEVDIEKFFDTIDHKWLREFLRKRVADGVLLRLIDKWLKAGVLENGAISYPEEGTPQGGVISPLLANIYLHYVLDEWFLEWKRRLKGYAFLVRFADDFVMGFTYEEDANKTQEELPKRFEKFKLRIHPTKTRQIDFRNPIRIPRGKEEARKSEENSEGEHENRSFDFLGFNLHWGKSQEGWWVVKTETAKGRISRTLKTISEWCKEHRHESLEEQHKVLSAKLKGHFGYFGRPGNFKKLKQVREGVKEIWIKWLQRRGGSNQSPGWLAWLKEKYELPRARITRRVLRC